MDPSAMKNKPATESKAKETIDYIAKAENSNGFSFEEKKELEKKLRGLSKKELDEVVSKIESTIYSDTKKDLLILASEAEKLNIGNGYEHLREDLKESGIMRGLFQMFDVYIDEKVKTNDLDVRGLSSVERDTIKLVLWEKLQFVLSPKGGIGFAIEGIVKSVGGSLMSLKNLIKNNKNKESETSLEDTYKAIQKILEKFGEDENTKVGVIQYIDSIMGNSFKNIDIVRKLDENKEINFNNSDTIKAIINGEIDITKLKEIKLSDREENFESIKKEAMNIGKNLKDGKELGIKVAGLVDKLPKVFGDKIKGLLKGVMESFPILGFLLSFILGPKFLEAFLSGESKNRKDSLKNLLKFSESKNNPINGLDKEFLKKIEPKKLDVFFKYLDGKELDYSKDGFWEAILSGKTKNVELLGIYNLLKGGKDKFILTDKDKKNGGEGFITRLNGLQKLAEKKQAEEKAKSYRKLEEDTIAATTIIATTTKGVTDARTSKKQADKKLEKAKAELEQQKDEVSKKEKARLEKLEKQVKFEAERLEKAEKEAKKAKLEAERLEKEKQKRDFEESVSKIDSLPAEILYKGEKLSLGIEENNIVLGNNKYNISIIVTGKEKFEKIEFKNGAFILNGNKDTPITKEQVRDLIVKLQNGEDFVYNGIIKDPILGLIDIKYKLIIKKI